MWNYRKTWSATVSSILLKTEIKMNRTNLSLARVGIIKRISIIFLVFLQFLFFRCGSPNQALEERILQSLKEPARVEISGLYQEVLGKPMLKSDITRPQYFRYKERWALFVPYISEVIVLDSAGNILFRKAYAESGGFMENKPTTIRNGTLKAVRYGKFLFCLFYDKVVKIDLETFEEETIKITFPKGIAHDDICLFFGEHLFLLSLGDVSAMNVSDLFLVDMDKGSIEKIFSTETEDIRKPHLLIRKVEDRAVLLKQDSRQIITIDLKGRIVDKISFENPTQYKFRPTPRLTSMSQLAEAEKKLISDSYVDFYINNRNLYVLYKIMSRNHETKMKSELLVTITDLDSFYLDERFIKFAEDGSILLLEETDASVYLENWPLDRLRDMEKKEVSFPF